MFAAQPDKAIRSDASARTTIVAFSQHFFALKLNKADVVTVLAGAAERERRHRSGKPQIVQRRPGGRSQWSRSRRAISKERRRSHQERASRGRDPDLEAVRPGMSRPGRWFRRCWAMPGERSATWWMKPWIYHQMARRGSMLGRATLGPKPGPVAIAGTGAGMSRDQPHRPLNHAKFGTTTSADKRFSILGDLNQQGAIAPPGCDKSQNGRGGLFFVVRGQAVRQRDRSDRRRHRSTRMPK